MSSKSLSHFHLLEEIIDLYKKKVNKFCHNLNSIFTFAKFFREIDVSWLNAFEYKGFIIA